METQLQKAIIDYESKTGSKFRPKRDFYNRVGINQKRFGLLVKGKLPMYVVEQKELSKYFGSQVV